MLESAIIIVHLLVALSVIVLVLIQHGKGADMGASFGGGSSNTVFGSQGSASFLSRVTAVLVAVFFITSIGLTYYAKSRANPSLFDKTAPVSTQTTSPKAPVVDDTKNDIPAVDHAPAPTNEKIDSNSVKTTPAATSNKIETATNNSAKPVEKGKEK